MGTNYRLNARVCDEQLLLFTFTLKIAWTTSRYSIFVSHSIRHYTIRISQQLHTSLRCYFYFSTSLDQRRRSGEFKNSFSSLLLQHPVRFVNKIIRWQIGGYFFVVHTLNEQRSCKYCTIVAHDIVALCTFIAHFYRKIFSK